MLSRTTATAVVMLFLATAAAESDAKVLARGETVSEQPVTVIAMGPAFKPSRIMLDVVLHPSVPAWAEWIVLCPEGPGPATGGDLVTERPAHRRLKLPRRPRGLCHVHVEAAFVNPDQAGRIAVTLRGRVRKAPIPLQFGARRATAGALLGHYLAFLGSERKDLIDSVEAHSAPALPPEADSTPIVYISEKATLRM